MDAERPFLSIAQVAALLAVSKVRAYQMAAEGRFPVVRLTPRRIRIPRAAFSQWLDAQAAKALRGLKADEV